MMFSDFIYYLSQDKPLPFNCSLYYLTNGNLTFKNNGTDVMETAAESFLSGYYITNCTLDEMYNFVKSLDYSNFSSSTIETLYSNKRDDGDSYVALLFVSSGSCVTAWMLSLLLYLSPKHKQKPIVVYLATLCYSISTTIFLDTLTKDLSKEYYTNALDILQIRNTIGNNLAYLVFCIISQVLFDLSWLQLIVHMTRQRFKLLQVVLFGALVIIYIPWNIIYLLDFQNISSGNISSLSLRWKLVNYSFRIIITIYFIVCLLYYTFRIKNPKKISFAKTLIPIGTFSLIVLLLEVVVISLELHIYKSQWLTSIWLSIFPQVLQVISLTIIWEWLYDMEYLEKKLELQGVLGRRLSRDDILQLDNKVSGKKRTKLIDVLLFVGGRKSGTKSLTSDVESICMQDLTQIISDKNRSHENYLQRELQVEDSSEFPSDLGSGLGGSVPDIPTSISTRSSQQSCEIEYIDDYNLSDSDEDYQENIINHHDANEHNDIDNTPQESNISVHYASTDNHPPPFEPLPGFSIDDYEDEKSHHSHIN